MNIDEQMIAIGYTIYSHLCPAGKTVMDINSFASACEDNLQRLLSHEEPSLRSVPVIEVRKEKSVINVAKSEQVLQKGVKKAEEMLEDNQKLEGLLDKVKEKMKVVPKIGGMLTYLPAMFKLVTSYVKNEYTDIPKGKLALIISAMIYVVSPIDLVPDTLPILGWLDDVGIIAACVKMTGNEIDKYLLWRDTHKKQDSVETEELKIGDGKNE